MQKIPVLIFVNSFRLGGSERQAVALIKRLDRSRFDVVVACFQREGPLTDELPREIIALENFPLTSFANWNACRQAVRFLSLLRSERIKIVQCFDFYSNVFAIPLARLAGIPVILGSRRDEARMRTGAQHRCELWSYRLATGVVANAEAIREQLLRRDKVCPEKVWVIHNGLDLDRFDRYGISASKDPISQGKGLRIAVVGNLRPEKGHLVFLDAVQRLRKSNPESRFLIVGDGVMRDRIEARVKELGLSTHVQLTGMVKDIPAMLRSVDVAVVPSIKNEGFPNVVMEAMAASLPVVATDTGGTSELLVDGLTGFLVLPGDAAALAARIGKLSDVEARRKMGEAGRQRITEYFTADRMARKFEDLYSRLASPC